MNNVLSEAQRGFTTRSDFARSHANEIAQAACLGLISTKCPDGTFGRIWSLTPLGLTTLFKDNPHREEIPYSAARGVEPSDVWSYDCISGSGRLCPCIRCGWRSSPTD